MATRININGIHELQFSLPGTTSASIASPGATLLANAGFNGVNSQTANYTLQSSDNQKLVAFNGTSALTATLPQPGSSGIDSNFAAWIANLGTATVTVTPTSATIDGAATLALAQNQGVIVFTDGTNYFTVRGMASSGGGGGTTPLFGAANPTGANTPALVQSNSSSTGQTVSTTNPVTAGNLLVVAVSAYTSSQATITDNLGTAYTMVYFGGGSSNALTTFVGIAGGTGVCTVTTGTNTSPNQAIGIAEFSQATTSLDGTVQSATGNSATTTTLSVTTAVANDLLIFVYADGYGNNTGNPSTGWTKLFFNQGHNWVDLGLAYQIASSTGTYTGSWTEGAAAFYIECVIPLKAASTPVAGTEGQLYFDTTNSAKYAGYVYHNSAWNNFS